MLLKILVEIVDWNSSWNIFSFSFRFCFCFGLFFSLFIFCTMLDDLVILWAFPSTVIIENCHSFIGANIFSFSMSFVRCRPSCRCLLSCISLFRFEKSYTFDANEKMFVNDCIIFYHCNGKKENENEKKKQIKYKVLKSKKKEEEKF